MRKRIKAAVHRYKNFRPEPEFLYFLLAVGAFFVGWFVGIQIGGPSDVILLFLLVFFVLLIALLLTTKE